MLMKKLIFEIDCDENVIEEGDIENIFAFGKDCSIFMEFGRPHHTPELGDKGIAETFAIVIQKYSVRLEDDKVEKE